MIFNKEAEVLLKLDGYEYYWSSEKMCCGAPAGRVGHSDELVVCVGPGPRFVKYFILICTAHRDKTSWIEYE